MIEEEFRSQNSGVRINQSGIQTSDFIVDHQIENLVGVLNPFIRQSNRIQNEFCSDKGFGAISVPSQQLAVKNIFEICISSCSNSDMSSEYNLQQLPNLN
ncbi:MAG: hypothetical protein V7K24_22920 [Nostoc sp.]